MIYADSPASRTSGQRQLGDPAAIRHEVKRSKDGSEYGRLRTAYGILSYCSSNALKTELRQQPEHSNAIRRPNKYLAVHNRRRDELVARTEGIAASPGLVAIVEGDQIGGIVCVQRGGRAVFDGPHNSVARAIGRDAGCCSGITKTVGRLSRRAGR